MIRKLSTDRLRVGMYVHALVGSWMNHPFWRTRFLIRSETEIAKILDAGIEDVYIDISKGLDDQESRGVEEARREIESEIVAGVAVPEPEVPTIARRVSVAEELATARRIHGQAQQAIRGMMSEVRLGRAISVDMVEPAVEAITGSLARNSSALLGMLGIKNKDDYTFQHSVSVGTLLMAFGRTLGLPEDELREIGLGGMLHDVGKMKVPDAVLNKPGRLTDEEYAVIKRHPVDGHAILVETRGVGEVPLEITLHHHERFNGRGYPDGLSGESISRFSRMAAIVDVYDAITADRCYHKAMLATEALRRMWEWSANDFDRSLLQAFMKCIGIYPVGTVVRLESGVIGVVVEQNEESVLTPKVKAVFHSKSLRQLPPSVIDLARSGDKIASTESPERWPVDVVSHLTVA
ncbi:HD-GYP domain-containing protein [Pseudomarimonas salicorniae]|uniref:HD-GYP domain-containing protein n=1 Tax=Pseudomarimonas salicorniae TaxID=2933270 RepID=A0ABT0GKV1_9GAMM|nr:HD-GYP domain-containing protein [Lysobacter sp. CAU 1642]